MVDCGVGVAGAVGAVVVVALGAVVVVFGCVVVFCGCVSVLVTLSPVVVFFSVVVDGVDVVRLRWPPKIVV